MAKLCLKFIANKILRIKNKVLKIIYFTTTHKILKKLLCLKEIKKDFH